MAKIYKVNGYPYTYEDFVATLTDSIIEYWKDPEETDKHEFNMFVQRVLNRTLYEIEEFSTVESYGKFDFWAEEE